MSDRTRARIQIAHVVVIGVLLMLAAYYGGR